MSQFIKIANKADKVDRRFLEKLGISTKRDDDETIGQFGSGAKLAPIAALRRGMRWVFVASDDNGPYTLEYVSRNVDGIDTVFYKYDDIEKESSFTVDAGLLSWDEDFQIFREAFANAVDSKDEYAISTVDEIDDYNPGYAVTYLTATQEMVDIVENFNTWFTFDREPLFTTSYGCVYEASEAKSTRIFNKGVFVGDIDAYYRSEDVKLTYDWGFFDIPLNEERRIKSAYDVERKMRDVFLHVPDDNNGRAFVFDVLTNEPEELKRFVSDYTIPELVDNCSPMWKKVWDDVFGEDVIPIASNMSVAVIEQNLKFMNYRSRVVSPTLFKILSVSGVKTPTEVLGEKTNIKSIACPDNHVAMFEHAMRTAARYDSRLDKFKVSIMDDNDKLLGLAIMHNGEEEIFVSTKCLDLGFKKVVSTLIHELDHVAHGCGDESYTRFRDLADDRIADLIVEAGYDVDLHVQDGYISFPLNYVSTLGTLEYEIVGDSVGSILKIGDAKFFIDAKLDVDKGVMEIGGGNTLMISVEGIDQNTKIKKV